MEKICSLSLVSTFRYCFTISVFVYGFFHITLETIRTYIPIGMLLVCLFTIAIFFIRVPPPDAQVVETIMGKSLTEDTVSPTDYVMKTGAHRGAGLDAPENSLVAFEICSKKGCTAIEFDVVLTLDDVPVVFHDDSLERMTDFDLLISNTKLADLLKIDIAVKHPFKERFINTRIPTLQETVEQLLRCDQRMFIDLKQNNEKIIGIILNLYEQYPELYSKAVVTSFLPNIIYYIRRSNPKIVCSLAWRPYCHTHVSYSAQDGKGERRYSNILKHYIASLADMLHEWLLPRLTYYILGLSLMLLHKDVISPKVIADWRKKGIRVVAWTVNHPIEKQYFANVLKITYLTDTLTGENTVHASRN